MRNDNDEGVGGAVCPPLQGHGCDKVLRCFSYLSFPADILPVLRPCLFLAPTGTCTQALGPRYLWL